MILTFLMALSLASVAPASDNFLWDDSKTQELEEIDWTESELDDSELLSHRRYRCWARGRYGYTTTATNHIRNHAQRSAINKCIRSGHAPCYALGCRRLY